MIYLVLFMLVILFFSAHPFCLCLAMIV